MTKAYRMTSCGAQLFFIKAVRAGGRKCAVTIRFVRLAMVFGRQVADVTGQWIKQLEGALHDLYSSQNDVKLIIRWGRKCWAGHVGV
jgi:hypothetical protein